MGICGKHFLGSRCKILFQERIYSRPILVPVGDKLNEVAGFSFLVGCSVFAHTERSFSIH